MKLSILNIRSFIRVGMLWVFVLIFSVSHAQEMSDPVMKAKSEMQEMYGTVPVFFEVFPEHALPGVWEYFKQLNNPRGDIPPKYRELLQLAVASQIPCEYCVYFHTAAAEAYGATQNELREAVAHSAFTRHWSTILQGNDVDMSAFEKEVDMIFEEMAKKPDN